MYFTDNDFPQASMVGKKLGIPIVDVIRNHHERIAILEEKMGETR